MFEDEYRNILWHSKCVCLFWLLFAVAENPTCGMVSSGRNQLNAVCDRESIACLCLINSVFERLICFWAMSILNTAARATNPSSECICHTSTTMLIRQKGSSADGVINLYTMRSRIFQKRHTPMAQTLVACLGALTGVVFM